MAIATYVSVTALYTQDRQKNDSGPIETYENLHPARCYHARVHSADGLEQLEQICLRR